MPPPKFAFQLFVLNTNLLNLMSLFNYIPLDVPYNLVARFSSAHKNVQDPAVALILVNLVSVCLF